MHGIIMGLENRVKNMNNDMIKLDIQISDALNLRQDEERISRADGKEDARERLMLELITILLLSIILTSCASTKSTTTFKGRYALCRAHQHMNY